MREEQKERFSILLQQLQLTSSSIANDLAHGRINKVVVNKQTKCWHF